MRSTDRMWAGVDSGSVVLQPLAVLMGVVVVVVVVQQLQQQQQPQPQRQLLDDATAGR